MKIYFNMLRLWSGKQDWKEVPTQARYHTRVQEHRLEEERLRQVQG